MFAPTSWFASRPKPPPPTPSVVVAEPIDAAWWTVFNDPILTELEQQVAASNLDVRLATIRLQESRLQRGVTAADEYPNANGNASYTREKISDRGVIGLLGGSSNGSGTSVATSSNGLGWHPGWRAKRRHVAGQRWSRHPSRRFRPVPERLRLDMGDRLLGPGAAPGRIGRRQYQRLGRGTARLDGHGSGRTGAGLPAVTRAAAGFADCAGHARQRSTQPASDAGAAAGRADDGAGRCQRIVRRSRPRRRKSHSWKQPLRPR